MVRGAALAAAAVASVLGAGCSPEIGSGSYYCGPERACPEDLRCDEASALCVFVQQVEPFTCGPTANDHEPDDGVADAFDLGVAGCGGFSILQTGCIDSATDVDYLTGVTPAGCAGDLDIRLTAPVAFMPVQVELLDDSGAVVAGGAVCVEADDDGEQQVCLSAELGASAGFQLRVQRAEGGDCGGACAYNRYALSIF